MVDEVLIDEVRVLNVHAETRKAVLEILDVVLDAKTCDQVGNARIDAGPLVMILAVIIVFAGACTLRPPKPGRKGSPFWLGWKGRAVIGGATGFMAGLTGAGGPVASIPWMVLVGYSPIHAVALSMPYQIATSFSGSVGNMMGGHVDWMLLPALCAVQVVGLLGGIAMAQRVSAPFLRKVIGALCIGLGACLFLRQAGCF